MNEMRLVGLTLRNADDRHDEEKNKDQHVDHASTGGLAGDAAVHVGIIVFAIAVAFRFGHDINAGDHADHAHDDADRRCEAVDAINQVQRVDRAEQPEQREWYG